MAPPERTIGQAIAGTDLLTAAMLAGLGLVVIGSIGPWVTAPLSSASGLDGDGKWTLLLAVLIAFAILRRGPGVGSGIACVVLLADGIYQVVHIHHVVAKVTYFGTQLDHVGWGLYAVIAGALLTLSAIVKRCREAR